MGALRPGDAVPADERLRKIRARAQSELHGAPEHDPGLDAKSAVIRDIGPAVLLPRFNADAHHPSFDPLCALKFKMLRFSSLGTVRYVVRGLGADSHSQTEPGAEQSRPDETELELENVM